MYSSIFYKVSWTAQVAAGIVLFTLSFLIESYVLAQYLDNAALAMALAGALEISKALSVVFYRFMKTQTDVGYPAAVAIMLLVFRLTLLILSLICSIMYFAEQLDRPYLESIKAADRERVERDFSKRVTALQLDFQERRTRAEQALRLCYQRLAEQASQRWLPAIGELENLLSKEMDNSRNGEFVGPRYREIERRLGNEKDQYSAHLSSLSDSEHQEQRQMLSDLSERYESSLHRLRDQQEANLSAIRGADYRGDPRVEHAMLNAVLAICADLFGATTTPLQFVVFFSIFVSFIVELGIVVIFEHIALSYMSLFQAEHSRSLHLNKRRICAEGEVQAERIDDSLLREQIARERKRVERRMRKATEALSA